MDVKPVALHSLWHPQEIGHRIVHREILNVSRMTLGFVRKSCIYLCTLCVCPHMPPKSPKITCWRVNHEFPCGHSGPFGQTIEVRSSFTLDDVVAQVQDGKIRAPHCRSGSKMIEVDVAQIARDMSNMTQESINYTVLYYIYIWLYMYLYAYIDVPPGHQAWGYIGLL